MPVSGVGDQSAADRAKYGRGRRRRAQSFDEDYEYSVMNGRSKTTDKDVAEWRQVKSL